MLYEPKYLLIKKQDIAKTVIKRETGWEC